MPSLANAPWLVAPATQSVLGVLEAGGYDSRAVGGTVRNALMGLPVTDTDIATTAPPEETMRLARLAGLQAHPTGLQHGTVTLVAHGVSIEVTTLRRDVETFGRHATVAFTDNWTEDARRRDFTINALYCDRSGGVHDPLGGYPDIVARRVRFIGDPHDRIGEDYLRILRFFRFQATHGLGPFDEPGLAACAALKAGLRCLSAERIRSELIKLVVAPGAQDAVTAMAAAGIWHVMFDAPPDLARFDRLTRIETALDLSPDPIGRLAALTLTAPVQAAGLADRLRLSSAQAGRLAIAAATIDGRTITPAAGTQRAMELLYRLGPEAFRITVLLSWAMAGSAPDDAAWQALARLGEHGPPPRLPVKGADIVALGVAPGPGVGAILARFEDWWIADGFPQDPVHVHAALGRIVAEHQS
ncbi:MAG: CCA tRNA nucleotidyltransferase [Hyphomicrobiaceae bacterium]|nr:CCA tRNA nucleotidyltransferase [Hyphomicrobiaceae bacterium]